MDKYDTVIVIRHGGAVEWLRMKGVGGEVIAHAEPVDVAGKIVYGILPLWLAAMTEEVVVIDMPDLRPEDRGRDLSPEEMDAAGACLVGYEVRRTPSYGVHNR